MVDMTKALNEFVIQWNGKYCEVAGSPGARNQCVDLANAFIRDALGLPIIEWTNAVDFPEAAGDKYEFIPNTPTNVPKQGDLIIWKPSPGHIAIFIEGDAKKFKSFDQNFPTGSPCHVQDHDYTNVRGWLRAKNPPGVVATITIPTTERDWLVGRAGVAKDVAVDLKIEDPDHAPFEKYQRVLSGIRGRVTELENNVNKTNADLKIANTNTQNERERGDNIQHLADESAKRAAEEYTALEKKLVISDELVGQYKTALVEKDGVIREVQKADGLKKTRITELETQLALTQKDQNKQLVTDILRMVKSILSKWTPKES
jgi:hypothetical protein